jgi:CubicO group peptidase (beta-lactamase class C family)
MRSTLLILLMIFATQAPAATVDWAAIEADVAKQADEAVDSRKAGGLGLAVIEDGEVRFLHVSGISDRETKAAFDVDTPVPVGEVTRLAVVAMALRLVAAHKLDLDARVVSLLPELRFRGVTGKVGEMRVRHLITDHSGLVPNRLYGMFRKPGDKVTADPLAEPLQLVADPGTLMSTSNLGYAVLGRVLERASGRKLDVLLDEEVRVPLGLRRTAFGLQQGMSSAHRKGKTEPALVARDRAASGLTVSLRDLATLVGALTPSATRDWLSTGARRSMLQVQNASVVLDVGNKTGLGWGLADSIRPRVGRVALLSSTFPNFNAQVRLLPEHGIAVVAISNWRESDEDLSDLMVATVDAILQAKAGIAPRDVKRLIPDRVVLPAGATADTFGARYATPIGLMEFSPKKSDYDLRFLGFDFRADRRDDGWYGMRFRLLGMIPLKFDVISRVVIRPVVLAGHHVILGFADGNYFLFGSTFADLQDDVVPADLLGEYRVLNPDALSRQMEVDGATITLEDRMLTLDYVLPFILSVRPRIALLPDGPDRLVMAGFGPSLGEVVDVERKEGKVRLKISGYELERTEE